MPRNKLVREVMTTDVITFSPDESVQSAVNRLIEKNVDAGPVVDDDGRVVGMLSTGDLIVQETQLHFPTVITLFGAYLELPSQHRHFEADLQKALGSTVREVMTPEPVTCGPDATVERAATLMHDRDVSRLPVVESDRLVGIISRGDIVRAIVRGDEAGH
ncbi:MAG: CBS domain-containing protein [Acidimicrobiales bacterium]